MKIRRLFLLYALSLTALTSCGGPNYTDINNVDDFINMKNDGYYRLKCDLDFQKAKINPIGTRDNPFTGQFLGGNHTISNFAIDASDNVGLFGFVKGSISSVKVVTDFNISNCDYTSVGLLAGNVDGAKISDCSATGNISITTSNIESASNVGGLVGYSKKSEINKCHASVNITATSVASIYIGGLVGYNGGEKALESGVINSYVNNATLSGKVSNIKSACYVGGVVAKNYGTIDKCFSHHIEIKGHSDKFNVFVGGVVADNNDGLVTNSFAASNLTSTHTDAGRTFRGLVIGRNFSSDIYKERGLALNNYGASNVTYNDDDTADSIEQMVSDIAYLLDLKSSNWYKNILNYGDTFKYRDGSFPSLDDNFVAVNEIANLGSPENPIKINNASDLTNVESNKSYILNNDIDLSGVNYSPIGTYEKPYTGVFNGNFKTIKNIKITSTSTNKAKGLFGFLNGLVKNLKVENNITLTGDEFAYSGALAGYAQKSIIHNCHATVTCDITAESSLFGGLIGYVELCDVYRCSVSGTNIKLTTTTSTAVYGGLIGTLISSRLSQCFSTVNINVFTGSSETTVGGLIGTSDSVVNDVYAHSNIEIFNSTGKINEGGLIGRNKRGNLVNAYVKSVLKCNDMNKPEKLIGGLIGYNDGAVNNCYYAINDEVRYSCGTSIKEVQVKRVTEANLKGLAKQLGDSFYDGDDNLPHLNFEKEGF